jgi:hypothetical protein
MPTLCFDDFMEEMIAARYNLWWYLSFIVPAAVMIVGTFWRKKHILIIAIILSVFSTYALTNISVHQKWKKRYEIAQTQEELEYASDDGANLVFAAIVIGPFEAIFYTAFWGFLGWKLWPKFKNIKGAT